jgi:hypothetical protein
MKLFYTYYGPVRKKLYFEYFITPFFYCCRFFKVSLIVYEENSVGEIGTEPKDPQLCSGSGSRFRSGSNTKWNAKLENKK